MVPAYLMQDVVRDDRHRYGMRDLLPRQSEQFACGRGASYAPEVTAVESMIVVEDVGNADEDLIGDNDGGNEVAPARPDVLRRGQYRCDDLTDVPVTAAWPVVGVDELRIA